MIFWNNGGQRKGDFNIAKNGEIITLSLWGS